MAAKRKGVKAKKVVARAPGKGKPTARAAVARDLSSAAYTFTLGNKVKKEDSQFEKDLKAASRKVAAKVIAAKRNLLSAKESEKLMDELRNAPDD